MYWEVHPVSFEATTVQRFRWKSPHTVIWQDNKRQGCVLKGSIIERTKQKQSGTSPSKNCHLNNINCVLKVSSHSVSLTPSGRNGNRNAEGSVEELPGKSLVHIFSSAPICSVKLDFTPAYFNSHKTDNTIHVTSFIQSLKNPSSVRELA